MQYERRKGEKPIPDNYKSLLNEAQIIALNRLTAFGWNLKFVRRPLFQEPVPVLWNAHGNKIALLEEDGKLNMKPDIKIR